MESTDPSGPSETGNRTFSSAEPSRLRVSEVSLLPSPPFPQPKEKTVADIAIKNNNFFINKNLLLN